MPLTQDLIKSQIPSWILEAYPNFYEFLYGYYSWAKENGNAYERLKNHNDYFALESTLDEYVDFLFKEFLVGMPETAIFDKSQFIRYSRKFNQVRGSQESIKFLFRTLFNEQNVEVYIPKNNILKTSDGVWIAGESKLQITYNENNSDLFQFQRIVQTRPIYEDIAETASAIVQNVVTKYVGRYLITELSISDIQGEFKAGFPVTTDSGASEFLIPTTDSITITDGGTGYETGQTINIDTLEEFTVERVAETNFEFDTRITSSLSAVDIILKVNNVTIPSFEFDGRTIFSNSILEDDDVSVIFPTYTGYIVVDDVNETGSIQSFEIKELTIGSQTGLAVGVNNGSGSGIQATLNAGFVVPTKGYFANTKGQLSSDMYLHDSFYYQVYSYVIRTQQNFNSYSDIVKKTLHPAGFALFGQVNILNFFELVFNYIEVTQEFVPEKFLTMPKYSLGGSYSFAKRFKDANLSTRLYPIGYFNAINNDYIDGESGYDLEADDLTKHNDYEYGALKGWMAKNGLTDNYLFIPQDYVEYDLYGGEYVETGYLAGDIDEALFLATYINIYMTYDYAEEGYAE